MATAALRRTPLYEAHVGATQESSNLSDLLRPTDQWSKRGWQIGWATGRTLRGHGTTDPRRLLPGDRE